MPPTRSVAKADVAELTAALDSAVDQEKAHHLVIVSTNKVLSTTQFKQMFYSRGDDFFQIANVYECPDSCNSVHSSVWGIDCQDPHAPSLPNAQGLVTMDGNRLTGQNEDNQAQVITLGYSSGGTAAASDDGNSRNQQCFNFNKLGGRENDPKGCAWAYSYASDGDRNFYAQHEVMGYLEKDTCVKRDFWTACSRMSIEDQLYGLAFASETDQDLCMEVTCARRWSEVEDALAESCAAADRTIRRVKYTFTLTDIKLVLPAGLLSGEVIAVRHSGSAPSFQIWSYTAGGATSRNDVVADINTGSGSGVVAQTHGWSAVAQNGSSADEITLVFTWDEDDVEGDTTTGTLELVDEATCTGCHADNYSTAVPETTYTMVSYTGENKSGHVDLYINVRVSNGHPKALDTILRVRFTVAYVLHEPSALHTWNTRASKAASGVIKTGVVGDAPEGGKLQQEDTTVVVA